MNDTCIVHPPEYDSYSWDIFSDVLYTEIILHDKLNPKYHCHPKIEAYVRKHGSKAGQIIGLITHRHIE